MKSLTVHPIKNDIQEALADFAPLYALVVAEDETLEGQIPVITPKLADIQCVACVYADPHQDLPYPRYTALAPIKVRPDATLFVEAADKTITSIPLITGQIVLFDAHLKHWVNKPLDYPSNWEDLGLSEKNAYKKKNVIVFANVDFETYPSLDDIEKKFRSVLCLSHSPKNTPKRSRF